MGRIPNSISPFFLLQKTGLTTEGVLPPGPDHAFDSACIKTALAQEIYRRRTQNAPQRQMAARFLVCSSSCIRYDN